jgi:threonine synthase
MADTTWYECIRGCGRRYSVFEVVYRCEDCGGLLDVTHDLGPLRTRSGAEWRVLFEARGRTNQRPFNSGVWSKHEWVLPLVAAENIVSTAEGYTNLFPASAFGAKIGVPNLWVKLCGNSHTGSFKDLGMTVLVSAVQQMITAGASIQAIACASTGDTSAALAAYAAIAGIPAIVLLPKGKVSIEQLIQPISNGAKVLSLDTDFDGCMQIVQQLTKDPTIYLANSMNSLRIEGQKTVGIEIIQQLNWEVPDWIVIPAGNLGNVSALGKGLLMMKELGLIDHLPRIAAAQAAQAAPLFQSFQRNFEARQPVKAGPTLASAIQIGDPVSYERAVKTLQVCDGVVEQADEDELANAAVLADQTGLYACPHTGVALGALAKLREKQMIRENDRVVVISTAHGLKFSRFKVDYHRRELEAVSERYANPPIELPADYEAVKNAVINN